MKIATVLGTRPEIIRLSRIIPKLDELTDHVLIHTGQNFDRGLSDVFMEELGVRTPDHHLGVGASGTSATEQIAKVLVGCERVFSEERPDRLLVLGDTNSGLSAMVAKRLGIPVFHMEAGNRCYDDRVPEEVNRRIIDHSSDVLLPYTEGSRRNLLREGLRGERIVVTGNPIFEVIEHYAAEVGRSDVLDRLGLAAGGYFLVTLHRAENVDVPERLDAFTTALARLADEHGLPVVVSTHPRTRARLTAAGLGQDHDAVRFSEPFGFFDFVHLEQHARCVLSDSGTVQEECAIFRVPNVTLRDVTERPETLECGSNILTGADPDTIANCVRAVLADGADWTAPPEYLKPNVSGTVLRILLGFDLGVKEQKARRGP